ncbi:MAG: hypothetical protein AAGK01_09920 [Pseudomonadota bacterium]
MRTAVLAALKRTDRGELRALLPLAGRSVLGWQIDLARDLGCTRIICLCEAPGSEILELQQETEALGGEFHAVRGNMQLVSLLRADDQLVVLLDGVVIDRGFWSASEFSAERPGKAVYTCSPKSEQRTGLPQDFERIDAERIWCGLLTMRADTAQKLSELPPDSDAISSLLRIALQSGVKGVALPDEAVSDGSILVASSQELLLQRQKVIIANSAVTPEWAGPLLAVSILAGRWMEQIGVRQGVLTGAAIGVLLMTLGTVLAWGGTGAAGLALVAVGAFCGSTASFLFYLKVRLFQKAEHSLAIAVLQTALDVIPAVALVGAVNPALNRVELIALPLMSIGLIKLASNAEQPAVRTFWNDRALQFCVLAAAAAGNVLVEAVAVLGLTALGHKLLLSRRN